jgi:hypothetical protein
MRADHWTLRVELEIQWEPEEPVRALSSLEASLLTVLPGLNAHRCGGPPEYHVRTFAARRRDGSAGPVVEPALALAHIIEHVMIDAIAFVTTASSVSGVTGARRGSNRRFDVFVECRDPAVGALARHVGVTWTTAILRDGSMDPSRVRILAAARTLYRRGARVFEADRVADEMGLRGSEASGVIEELEKAGFAARLAFTMNFSGQRYYGMADAVA